MIEVTITNGTVTNSSVLSDEQVNLFLRPHNAETFGEWLQPLLACVVAECESSHKE